MYEMKMKKCILVTAVLLMTVSGLFAQAEFTKTASPCSNGEKSDKYRVLTNYFWDNWFVSVGGGALIYFGDHDKQMDFKDRISPALDVAVGKWFTPSIGVRVMYSGLQIKGLTKNGSHSTGDIYTKAHDGSNNLYKEKFDFFNVHGDVLFNLMNLLGGYKESRFYSLSPYIGVGWARAWQSPQSREPDFNIGLYNAFRLAPCLDLNLDIRGTLLKDDFDGELGNRQEEGPLSATIGLTYKFPCRSWSKCTPANSNLKYTEDDLNAIREKLNTMMSDNQKLNGQLAASQSVRVDTLSRLLVAPVMVIFQIGKSTLSEDMRVNLGFFAQGFKDAKSNVVYVITGYADNKTGSSKGNERLSHERAQAVYNCLTTEFGVPDSQLKIDSKGGVDNMFYNNPALSRVTITKAE
jgi:outer membrane protein OmpA-like peptidoglycan-associated protein